MKHCLIALLFVGCLQAESLADFTGICTGAADRVGVDEPQFAGGCRVQATAEELRITMSVRGPIIENINIMTGVKIFYRDDAGTFEEHVGFPSGSGFPPLMFVATDEICTFLIVPHDPTVERDLIRYVAERGNPVMTTGRMRVIIQPTEYDRPDSHHVLVRFIPDGPAPWYYGQESKAKSTSKVGDILSR